MRSFDLPVLSLSLVFAACSPSTDTKPPDNAGDIRVTDAGTPRKARGDDYEYVTERPLAIVALAEARGLPSDVARSAVDRIADALDVCATEQASAGKLTDGASRIIAVVAQDGTISGTNVTVSPPESGVQANALLCLVAPVRSLSFPPTTSTAQRALAIEAMWGRDVPHSKPKR
jgi:hypothetical protein